MDTQANYTVFDVMKKIFRFPLFLSACFMYVIYSLMNIYFSFETMWHFEILGRILTVITSIPCVVASAGFIILAIYGFKNSTSGFYIGFNSLKAAAVAKIITLIINTYLSLFANAESLNRVSGGMNGNYYIVGRLIGILLPPVIQIVFMILLIGFINRVIDSAESDIVMPEDGKAICVYMLIIAALNLWVYQMVSVFDGSGNMITFALAYVLLSLTIFLYRHETKKLYFIREDIKKKVSERNE